MMFVKVATTILAVASAALAVAIPSPSQGSCSTGSLQCCDTISPSSSKNDGSLAGLIPISLAGLNVPLGVNCIPISVIGIGSAGTCSAQSACCDGVTSSGVGLNCSPVNVGL